MKSCFFLSFLFFTTQLLADLPKFSDPRGVFLYLGETQQKDIEKLASIAKQPQVVGQILVNRETMLTKLRNTVAEQQTEGQLSVQSFHGSSLPVISNFANLIFISSGLEISQKEIMRALAPRGIAYRQKGSIWEKLEKPVPSDIDDWTHALYNPANTVVSKDTRVGPPRQLQWMTGPGWSRSHEHMVSFNAMVSEGGIVYYMVDMGSRSAVALPARWTLIARDGFNGKELWRKSLPSWMNHMWPLKSGPTQIQRRLVAVNGKVYLPLGALAPVSQLDGRTGEVLRTYEGTSNVDEIIVDGDEMIVQMGEQVAHRETYKHKDTHVWAAAGTARKFSPWTTADRIIMSINPHTGEKNWSHEAPCVAMTLNLNKDTAYFFDGSCVRALSRKDGKELWTSQKIVLGDIIKQGELAAGYAPTMFYYRGAVIIQIRESRQPGKIVAFHEKTGNILWEQKPQHSGHHSPEDLLPVQGLLWTGGTYRVGKDGGTFQGINPLTGNIDKEFPINVHPNYWFHQRCYRAKATERYIIPAATGTEYIDPKTGHWEINHWVRGGCLYGVMPANGMTYVPPNPCACFSESQLRTLGAFAPAEEGLIITEIHSEGRHIKGPAFESIEEQTSTAEDWPMYRRDIARSGATASEVSSDVREKWRLDFGSRLSAPVSSNGLTLVSLVDAHQIVAIDQNNGKIKWRYNTGSRINSAPTLYKGRVLFGGKDGWITCLRLKDGVLAWRFRSAPQNRQLLADEQIESLWPLIGSVLVHNERLYAVAGRSMFVDGGLLMTVLNPLTGELINEVRYDDIDPITMQSMQLNTKGSKLPISRPDVISAKGDFLYMGSQKIDKDGNRMWPQAKGDTVPGERGLTLNSSDQGGEDIHLMALSGLLDDSWFHRTYWLYGKATGGGWGGWMQPMSLAPAGRILSIGENHVFGYGRKPIFIRQSSVTEYQIFSTKKGQFSKEKAARLRNAKPNPKLGPEMQSKLDHLKAVRNAAMKKHGKRHPETLKATKAYDEYNMKTKQNEEYKKEVELWRKNSTAKADWKHSSKFDDTKSVAIDYDWRELDPKIMVRAMTLAKDTLIVAGPADLVDETTLYGAFHAEKNQFKLNEQEAAFNGKRGGHLWLLDANTGEHLKELTLSSVPVFDGMAVANGDIILSQANGELVSFGQ